MELQDIYTLFTSVQYYFFYFYKKQLIRTGIKRFTLTNIYKLFDGYTVNPQNGDWNIKCMVR